MSRPFLEGSLTKWTNVMKGWQHRWFVLDENAALLSYYTSREKMVRGVRRGCVRLKGAVLGIDNEEDGNFTITTDSKTFHFQARNSLEREVWITALENTILRHAPFYHEHQVQPILILKRHVPHHLLKIHFEDDQTAYETSIKKFESRIAQADVLLQILIEQIQYFQDAVGIVENVTIKPHLERIVRNYNVILDAVKLAIVLLQILKNTIDPLHGIGLIVTTPYSKRFSQSNDMSERNENSENESFTDDIQQSNILVPTVDVEMGSDCLETRRLVPAVAESLPDSSNRATMALVVRPEVVPEISYSSSDDDDFFDADEELYSPLQSRPGTNFSFISKDFKEASTLQKSNEPSTSSRNVVSASNPPMRKDGSLDYDALYEEDEEQNDLSMENHGSMITHLLSQVKIGMDLTKVVLPTFILETRSLLEMYADYFAHPDIFISVVDKKTPKDRIVQVVKWYLSAYHAGRKSAVAKKPYNPILGEVFFCHWNVPNLIENSENVQVLNGPVPWCSRDQLTFAAEQVSHHPPISAFYAECVSKKIFFEGFVYTKSKFLGLSVGVHNIGFGTVYLLDFNEDYVVTFPSGYGRSILTTPWIELGGAVSVTCKKSGYYANIEFHTKPFYGGKKHRITGEIFSSTDKKPFLTISGEWNGVMEAKWMESGKTEVFVDVFKMPVTKKIVRSISDQRENESRRLWKEVTAGLKLNDIEKATTAKTSLEQKQRDEAKKRKEKNLDWETKLFYEKTEGDWHYKKPLCDRPEEWE